MVSQFPKVWFVYEWVISAANMQRNGKKQIHGLIRWRFPEMGLSFFGEHYYVIYVYIYI